MLVGFDVFIVSFNLILNQKTFKATTEQEKRHACTVLPKKQSYEKTYRWSVYLLSTVDMCNANSHKRLEYPHSLSYQEISSKQKKHAEYNPTRKKNEEGNIP